MACHHNMLAAFLLVRQEFVGGLNEMKQDPLHNSNDRDRRGSGRPNLMKMLMHT